MLYMNMIQTQYVKPASAKHLNFLGSFTCPLKLYFKDSFIELLSDYHEKTGKSFDWFIPSGNGYGSSMHEYRDMWKARSIDAFPDVVASLGFGDYFRKDFVNNFINKGYFKQLQKKKINKDFTDINIQDPDGNYNIYSIFPLVMMIDNHELGNLPMPRRWEDLLKPIYKNKIVITGVDKNLAQLLPLYIFKEHGDNGLKMLASNIKCGCHASKMSKIAGTTSTQGGAIYILSWFFAKACPRRNAVTVVWPEDGAIAEPIFLLVKQSKINEVAVITDYITGETYGRKSVEYSLPVLNPNVDNKLPKDAKFKWLGWDYIKSNSMDEIREHVRITFKHYLDQFMAYDT